MLNGPTAAELLSACKIKEARICKEAHEFIASLNSTNSSCVAYSRRSRLRAESVDGTQIRCQQYPRRSSHHWIEVSSSFQPRSRMACTLMGVHQSLVAGLVAVFEHAHVPIHEARGSLVKRFVVGVPVQSYFAIAGS
jgi:hypothetical protein